MVSHLLHKGLTQETKRILDTYEMFMLQHTLVEDGSEDTLMEKALMIRGLLEKRNSGGDFEGSAPMDAKTLKSEAHSRFERLESELTQLYKSIHTGIGIGLADNAFEVPTSSILTSHVAWRRMQDFPELGKIDAYKRYASLVVHHALNQLAPRLTHLDMVLVDSDDPHVVITSKNKGWALGTRNRLVVKDATAVFRRATLKHTHPTDLIELDSMEQALYNLSDKIEIINRAQQFSEHKLGRFVFDKKMDTRLNGNRQIEDFEWAVMRNWATLVGFDDYLNDGHAEFSEEEQEEDIIAELKQVSNALESIGWHLAIK